MDWLTELLKSFGEGAPATLAPADPAGMGPPPELPLDQRAQGLLESGSPYMQERLDGIVKGLAPQGRPPWQQKLGQIGEKLTTQQLLQAGNPGGSMGKMPGGQGLPVAGQRAAPAERGIPLERLFSPGIPGDVTPSPEDLRRMQEEAKMRRGRGRFMFE